MEVGVEDSVHVAFEIAVGFQEIGDGCVPETVVPFGRGHFQVEGEAGFARKLAQFVQDRPLRICMAGDHAIGRDMGAGVNEGIARNPFLVLKLHQRIEPIARRLPPDTLPKRSAP